VVTSLSAPTPPSLCPPASALLMMEGVAGEGALSFVSLGRWRFLDTACAPIAKDWIPGLADGIASVCVHLQPLKLHHHLTMLLHRGSSSIQCYAGPVRCQSFTWLGFLRKPQVVFTQFKLALQRHSLIGCPKRHRVCHEMTSCFSSKWAQRTKPSQSQRLLGCFRPRHVSQRPHFRPDRPNIIATAAWWPFWPTSWCD
jgi:hypothetical protein